MPQLSRVDIEVDRRLVKKRITLLRDRLGGIERERAVQRYRRLCGP